MKNWVIPALVASLGVAQASPHVVSGTVRDYDGRPIAGARVELKSPTFQALYTTTCDGEGRYRMTVEDGRYIALEAIKPEEYGKTALEFWAWNVPVHSDIAIDLRYHRLEIYGVNVFAVQRSTPSLFVYFRPMSLSRAKAKDPSKDRDIAPQPEDLELEVVVNGAAAKIDTVERVEEFTGGGPKMYAYLVHFTPSAALAETNTVRVIGHDKANGDRGEALTFYTPPDYRR